MGLPWVIATGSKQVTGTQVVKVRHNSYLEHSSRTGS